MFSDEKLFIVEPVLNRQNNKIIAAHISAANECGHIVGRSGHPKAFMVWGAVTSDSKSNLVFIYQGVKINSGVYLNDVPIKELHPWIHFHFCGPFNKMEHRSIRQDASKSGAKTICMILFSFRIVLLTSRTSMFLTTQYGDIWSPWLVPLNITQSSP